VARRPQGLLPTERPNPASRGLDTRSIRSIVRVINDEDARVARAVRAQARAIEAGVEAIAASMARGGRLFFVGAGTSGRLGILEAAECPPTFGTPPSLIRAIMAGGPRAVFCAKEGAEDDPVTGGRRIRAAARRGDAVVGVAASGVTPFVRGALLQARRMGCRTILVTSNPGTSIHGAEIVIAPGVGPEVVSGSTRMKCGTAAKLVLNTLTTASMIRLGKVYDNYMVDLRITNAKLERRALRILGHLTGLPPRRTGALLREAGGSVKTGILMARRGLGRAQARRRLAANGGFLRRALEERP